MPATANSWADRATALLTPEASPACSSSTEDSTVAVSGATVATRPSPRTTTGGSTSAKYDAPGPIRPSSRNPAAISSGPTVIGVRGPIRPASCPARPDRPSISSVIGSRAAPDSSAEYPSTCWRNTTTTKVAVPRAPYTTTVTRFAPVKRRPAKIAGGSIGCGLRNSVTTNAASSAAPPISVTSTRGDWQVDQEDVPPGADVDQPAADERADRGGHRGQAGPGADGAAAVLEPEGGLQDGQAAGGEQRAADALQHAAGDQHRQRRRDRAHGRGQREPDDADHEQAAPAEPVAERATEQDQGGEHQHVAVQDPLQPAHVGVEVAPHRGQRHVDHRAVEEGHAGAECCGGENPARPRCAVLDHTHACHHASCAPPAGRGQAGLQATVLASTASAAANALRLRGAARQICAASEASWRCQSTTALRPAVAAASIAPIRRRQATPEGPWTASHRPRVLRRAADAAASRFRSAGAASLVRVRIAVTVASVALPVSRS